MGEAARREIGEGRRAVRARPVGLERVGAGGVEDDHEDVRPLCHRAADRKEVRRRRRRIGYKRRMDARAERRPDHRFRRGSRRRARELIASEPGLVPRARARPRTRHSRLVRLAARGRADAVARRCRQALPRRRPLRRLPLLRARAAGRRRGDRRRHRRRRRVGLAAERAALGPCRRSPPAAKRAPAAASRSPASCSARRSSAASSASTTLSPETVGSFDVVVCGSLMLHLKNPLAALEAIRSVCTGHFLSAEQIDPLLTALQPRRAGGPPARRRATASGGSPNAAGHRTMVASAGFEIERTTKPYSIPLGASHVNAAERPPLRERLRRLPGRVVTRAERRPPRRAARPAGEGSRRERRRRRGLGGDGLPAPPPGARNLVDRRPRQPALRLLGRGAAGEPRRARARSSGAGATRAGRRPRTTTC